MGGGGGWCRGGFGWGGGPRRPGGNLGGKGGPGGGGVGGVVGVGLAAGGPAAPARVTHRRAAAQLPRVGRGGGPVLLGAGPAGAVRRALPAAGRGGDHALPLP